MFLHAHFRSLSAVVFLSNAFPMVILYGFSLFVSQMHDCTLLDVKGSRLYYVAAVGLMVSRHSGNAALTAAVSLTELSFSHHFGTSCALTKY